MQLLTSALAALALASSVAAHGGVLWYQIAGSWYKGFVPYNTPVGQVSIQREWDTYNPILDPTLAIMRCNDNGAVAQLSATVAAGSAITAYWNNPWPHNLGPMIVYMANCGGDCSNFDGSGNVWFKINEGGLISGTLSKGLWASGQMIANNNSWTVTIPSSLAPGNYLIRHETIALHSSNAPQWYPECANLVVTGSGTSVPSGSFLASIPGVYSMSDPNINIDIYSNANANVTTWTIPGPPVWPNGGSGGGTTTGGGGPTTTASRSTTLSTTVRTTTTTASGGSSTGLPQYSQCGGQGWTGSTVCASPYKCTAQNAYYSQCL